MNPLPKFLSIRAQRDPGPGRARGVLPAALSVLLFLNPIPPKARADGEVHVDFTFSGTFAPTATDTNKDGGFAEYVRAEADGRLEGSGLGALQNARLTSYSVMLEYGLATPADACTDCFRVNAGDFSVQEHAYRGPIAHLVRPIRDLGVNPSSTPYGAEEWTGFYRLTTGELIFVRLTSTEICVESAQLAGTPVPLCHVRQHETIVGGTGRFKRATGAVFFTAIAPTYTSDAPLINEAGCFDLTRKQPSFAFGPIHGAGHMTVQLND